MVSNAREDLPDPEGPVKTTSWCRGISTERLARLCCRAPRIRSHSTGRITGGPDGAPGSGLGSRDGGRIDVDATIAFIEANLAVGESEEGVIATHADVGASMEAGAALADDNGSCGNGFATEAFDAESLTAAIASVAGRSLSFLMGHFRVLPLFTDGNLLNFYFGTGLAMAHSAVVTFATTVFKGDDFGTAIVNEDLGGDFSACNDGLTDLHIGIFDHEKNIGELGGGPRGCGEAFNFQGFAFDDLVLFSSRTNDGYFCHKGKEYRNEGVWARRDFF